MPAIVDTHSHIGYFDEVADKEMVDTFTRARVLDHLDRFAYSGHALTYSLGSDTPTFIDARYSDDPKTFVDLRDESEQDTFTGARYFTVGRGSGMAGHRQPAQLDVLSDRESAGSRKTPCVSSRRRTSSS